MAIIVRTREDIQKSLERNVDRVAQGRAQAERDIAEGRLRFLMVKAHYSLAPWSGEYHRLLKSAFGIDPFVMFEPEEYGLNAEDSDAIRAFEHGHYTRMCQEIDQRFGPRTLSDLEQTARRLDRQRKTVGR